MSSRTKLHTRPIADRSNPGWMNAWSFPAYPPSLCDRTRRFYPSPANATPADLFEAKLNRCTNPGYRLIKKTAKKREIGLFFVGGACMDHGADREARAGVGIVYGPKVMLGTLSYALTQPQGETKLTSNRAELSAAILVLGMRYWQGEGFENIIIATDSEYLVLGICEHIHQWVDRRWRTSAGMEVANRDLWEKLLRGIRELEQDGCHVQFWLIPRELNEADEYAKAGAANANNAYGMEPGGTMMLFQLPG